MQTCKYIISKCWQCVSTKNDCEDGVSPSQSPYHNAQNVFVENYIHNSIIKRSISLLKLKDNECFFCLEEFNVEHPNAMKLQCCNQNVHEKCFNEWTNKMFKKLEQINYINNDEITSSNIHEHLNCPYCQSKLFNYNRNV